MVSPLKLALYAAAIFVVCSVNAELRLTPTISEYELDGVKLKQLAFPDGSTTVTYQPPRGWDYSGSATQLTLRPKNKAQAEATVTRIPQPDAVAFDDEGTKKLVNEAIAMIPEGSLDAAVVSQEKNPLMIEGKETLLIVLSYTIYGRHYQRSLFLLHRGDEQIRMQLTCLREDFQELQRVFMVSQYTWQHL